MGLLLQFYAIGERGILVVMSNYIEHRPWGSFENLLDEDYCKVKRIIQMEL